MNINTLKKCIAALKADQPNIQYILGMLETLVEMSEPTGFPAGSIARNADIVHERLKEIFEKSDEQEIIPPAAGIGPIGRIS